MATAIGTNQLNSLVDRHIIPVITDNIYSQTPLTYRMYQAKKMIDGGEHIEFPLLYKRFSNGGAYSGYDVLNVAPNDTIKNGALDWKQHQVPITIDGLTIIKAASSRSIANYVRIKTQQATEEMVANLSAGIMSDGSSAPKDITGLEAIVDDGGVAASYAGITRSTNTWWNAQDDSSTATLTLAALQTMHGNVGKGGRQPTLILAAQEQYNRYWALIDQLQQLNVGPSGHDEQLGSAGFTNLLFNNIPFVVDDDVFDGPNASNSAILFLNEDYLEFAVSPQADFYMQDWRQPIDQDVYVANLVWAGNLISMNCARQGKLSNISA